MLVTLQRFLDCKLYRLHAVMVASNISRQVNGLIYDHWELLEIHFDCIDVLHQCPWRKPTIYSQLCGLIVWKSMC